ncbi:MAG: ABC transporter permease [Bacteroidia bacterium]|nr:ABC transporter permease [Bacteroidia bacterium]MDW8088944.1 ABC transporter permease [Bacteroidia bacterium]
MIKEALKALWEYRVRAILTLSILVFGIVALVGIFTVLEALKGFIVKTTFGNPRVFFIQGGEVGMQIGSARRVLSRGAGLKPHEAKEFVASYRYPGAQAARLIEVFGAFRAVFGRRHTPPKVRLQGLDGAYLTMQGLRVVEGRYFAPLELQLGKPVAIIGHSLARQLFPHGSAVGRWIQVGSQAYLVVGVLEREGGAFGQTRDWHCYVPCRTVEGRSSRQEILLAVQAPTLDHIQPAMKEARRLLRQIRRLHPKKEDSFAVIYAELLLNFLAEQVRTITAVTVGVSSITLLGAILSLMNVLLVIVKERTAEIGLRMAVGATRRAIYWQFLSEAVVIAVLGGAIGIGMGVLAGNGIALLIGAEAVLPWRWIGLAVGVSVLVGVLAGLQPAHEAARLQPVEALRYE